MATLAECKNSILALKYRTQPCKYFPQCKFGDHCMFIHPELNSNASALIHQTEAKSAAASEVQHHDSDTDSDTDDYDLTCADPTLSAEAIADYMNAIGCLTLNIRNDWSSDVGYRTNLIAEWCRRIGRPKWADKALDSRIYEDGRWFRDNWWNGPYGGSINAIKDEDIKQEVMLNLLGYDD